jgi:hypothetical protein
MNRQGMWLCVVLVASSYCAGCNPIEPSPRPTPDVLDAGLSGPWDRGGPTEVDWVNATTLLLIRAAGNPSRQTASFVKLGNQTPTPFEVDSPPGCLSADIQRPRVIGPLSYLNRHCFAEDGNDRDDIIEFRDNQSPTVAATVPWLPDSYVQLPGGAWLAGFDSGPCAWIDLVPGTGRPPFSWPIVVDDDGAPYAINASPKGDCDGSILASSVDQSRDKRLLFVASGEARLVNGGSRADVPENVYLYSATDGVPRRVATGLIEARNVRWSPAGDSFIVIARHGGGADLLEFDMAGTATVLYTGNPVVAAWNPDGTQIALIEQRDTENRLLLLQLKP